MYVDTFFNFLAFSPCQILTFPADYIPRSAGGKDSLPGMDMKSGHVK